MTSVTSSKKLIAIRTIRTKYNSANSGALKKGFDLNVYKDRREAVLSFESVRYTDNAGRDFRQACAV